MKAALIAVLMTCHNRKEKTLASLEAVYKQELPLEVDVQVYLVDDGSTDGTAEAILATYPDTKLLQGDGNLFWNGGMRLAFAEALKSDHDYYLWLNDDTLLYPKALGTLLATFYSLVKQSNIRSIVVGSTCDPQAGALTYSGMMWSSWWHPLKFSLVEPSEEAKPCYTMNGNCVLIPREVAQLVGNLDPAFTHSTGDLDYGLRVRQRGGSVWLAPGYIGACSLNSPRGNCWEDLNLTPRERLQKVLQPKGLPIGEWKVFARRHAGLFWPFYWLLPYVRLLLISFFNGLRAVGHKSSVVGLRR